MKRKIITGLFLSCTWFAFAQSSVNAAGGGATGSGGNASYSVGQTVYSANEGSTAIEAQGVQQAYEVYPLNLSKNPDLIRSIVYPNPAVDEIEISVPQNVVDLSYQLRDQNGKLIQKDTIVSAVTTINVKNLPNGSYEVVLFSGSSWKNYQLIINH